MEDSRIDDDKDAEIVPLIGIPRKWANLTLKFYSFIFLGYTIWIAYQEFGSAAKTLKVKMAFLVPHLGAFSVFEAITIVAFIQVWDIIMYLTNRFKTDIEKIKATSEAQGRAEGRAEGEAQGRAEGEVQGRAEGETRGKAKAYRVWEDWYHRQENAKAQGVPFDEPPPSLNGDKTEE